MKFLKRLFTGVLDWLSSFDEDLDLKRFEELEAKKYPRGYHEG